jgi:hypothetical protein
MTQRDDANDGLVASYEWLCRHYTNQMFEAAVSLRLSAEYGREIDPLVLDQAIKIEIETVLEHSEFLTELAQEMALLETARKGSLREAKHDVCAALDEMMRETRTSGPTSPRSP